LTKQNKSSKGGALLPPKLDEAKQEYAPEGGIHFPRRGELDEASKTSSCLLVGRAADNANSRLAK